MGITGGNLKSIEVKGVIVDLIFYHKHDQDLSSLFSGVTEKVLKDVTGSADILG